MTRKAFAKMGILLLITSFLPGIVACGAISNLTATPTPTPSSTPTLTLIPTQTNTPLPTHTPSPTNTPLPTHTPSPTNTPLPTHTPSPTPNPYSFRMFGANYSIVRVEMVGEYSGIGRMPDGVTRGSPLTPREPSRDILVVVIADLETRVSTMSYPNPLWQFRASEIRLNEISCTLMEGYQQKGQDLEWLFNFWPGSHNPFGGMMNDIERGIPAKALVFVFVVEQTEEEFILSMPGGYTVDLRPLIDR